MAGRVRVGISGWTYAPWRGTFYPKSLRQRDELAYVAERLSSVEINGSFYALQRPASFRSWREQVPDDFCFALKGGRFITHMKRLADVETPLANFFASGVLALGRMLGPVLWQLPPTFRFDAERLSAFFDQLPRTTQQAADVAKHHDERVPEAFTQVEADRPVRHALEVRHTSFVDAGLSELLREHDIGLVVADTAGKWPALRDVTSDFVYVRLHGDTELYASGYDDQALDTWAASVREWADAGKDVYVYFDNDMKVRAPYDAMGLSERVADLIA